MAERNKAKILAYCEKHGVEVPPGAVARRSLGRYVAIKVHRSPPRLVAVTWDRQDDALQYVRGLAFLDEPGVEPSPATIRILDFKERVELLYVGGERFKRGNGF